MVAATGHVAQLDADYASRRRGSASSTIRESVGWRLCERGAPAAAPRFDFTRALRIAERGTTATACRSCGR